MKIVTYNVNGLRPRIAQFGSLLKLLDSFDADIICFQETKLRRQDLKADSVMADGYESFFSCTRTSEKGRAAYSGVATFCRVKSAFSSNEIALPVEAEEGFTGLLRNSQIGKGEGPEVAESLEKFAKDEILKVDSEGRCVITDHYHFVLFNIYGPRADSDDTERIQFKLNFFKMLQRRWESLLHCGRRIFVVGDLNIAPTSMDRCDAGPEFENNEFRKWFRSLLVEHGGHFLDAFRSKHPDRRDAYTCWPQNTGGEVFNYGSRIDHILCAGSCLHQVPNQQGHDFVTCHVTECEILTQYKRWKHGNSFRWKGERNVKLEGSDHAPVHIILLEMPDIPQHNTPSLSARYIPMIHGLQQTLVSLLMKRKTTEETIICKSTSSFDQNISALENCGTSQVPLNLSFTSSNPESGGIVPKIGENDKSFTNDNPCGFEHTKMMPGNETNQRKRQLSQMSLKSFFRRSSDVDNYSDSSGAKVTFVEAEVSQSNKHSCKILGLCLQSCSSEKHVHSAQDRDEEDAHAYSSEKEKNDTALSEWRRIQKVMQNSIPVCKGHSEPCVTRIVKKQGPNFGRRFYVCARAEGPASNPDANCGFFKWAASKNRHK